MRIVVVGGGYAGLSCLLELKRKCPDADRVLIDPATHHVRLTSLHEALDRPLADLRISFEDLGRRNGFRHIRERPILRPSRLAQFAASGRIPIGSRSLKFDRLVVATGARSVPRPAGAGFYAVGDLRRMEGMKLIERIAGLKGQPWISVVGGGATGLQYLFQLRDALRRVGANSRLRLVDGGERLLPEQPVAFHRYIKKRLDQSNIRYLPGRRLSSACEGRLEVVNQASGKKSALRSAITLVFLGLRGNPVFLAADSCGRLLYEGRSLETVFVAGDCSDYAGSGLNTKSAQAAVRKGRHVASTIQRQQSGQKPLRYAAKELGFFLSMGALDGIGWMGRRSRVVTGVPAFAVREAIETRYDLFVAGLDAYRIF
jgi:NADH dehydrogenase